MVVCFDLGGVLVRIRHTWEECLEAIGRSQGLLAQTLLPEFPLFDAYQHGAVSTDEYLDLLRPYLGVDTPEDARIAHNAILAEPYRGTAVLVEELARLGIATGCLSNTNALHWEEMNSGRFPAVSGLRFPVVSHEVGLHKPDPAIYAAFQAKVHALPNEVIYFEDGPANVAGALQVGWQAVLVDPEDDPALQMVDELKARGVPLFT